ncbi:MAG: S9 family peptidase, partial [Dokdonella sp.]
MSRLAVAALCALLPLFATPVQAITLDQAMANPDWIGPAVESPYWSADGKAIYYSLKRNGSNVRDLHRMDPASGKDTLIDPAMMANADGPQAVFSRDRQHAAFVRNGDVFIRDVASGSLRQITRSQETEGSVQFSADDRGVQFRIGNDWYIHDLAAGVTTPAAVVLAAKDPADKKPDDL